MKTATPRPRTKGIAIASRSALSSAAGIKATLRRAKDTAEVSFDQLRRDLDRGWRHFWKHRGGVPAMPSLMAGNGFGTFRKY